MSPEVDVVHLMQHMPRSPSSVGTPHEGCSPYRADRTTSKNVSPTKSAHAQTPLHRRRSVSSCGTTPHSELLPSSRRDTHLPSWLRPKRVPATEVSFVQLLAATTAVAFNTCTIGPVQYPKNVASVAVHRWHSVDNNIPILTPAAQSCYICSSPVCVVLSWLPEQVLRGMAKPPSVASSCRVFVACGGCDGCRR